MTTAGESREPGFAPPLSPLGPLRMSILGTCPLLAKSASLLSGLTLGAALLLTLVLSALTVSACRRFIALPSRFAFLFLITTTWVTVIELLLQAWWYPMADFLGIYVALLAVNCLVLAQLEEHAMASTLPDALDRAFGLAWRLALFVTVAGVLRELAAAGALLSDLSLPRVVRLSPIQLPLFGMPAGAFLVFALMMALVNRFPALFYRQR